MFPYRVTFSRGELTQQSEYESILWLSWSVTPPAGSNWSPLLYQELTCTCVSQDIQEFWIMRETLNSTYIVINGSTATNFSWLKLLPYSKSVLSPLLHNSVVSQLSWTLHIWHIYTNWAMYPSCDSVSESPPLWILCAAPKPVPPPPTTRTTPLS